ncbi:unnamed protein product [Staurois parvus]|uniref:Peptidase S1 domain-containing protein n=1 Tax=Staurois parvus TaxID=386267 RepID=A0ABN9G0U3_9NEOB|nr:unnamed protein product [Staurois parvus]
MSPIVAVYIHPIYHGAGTSGDIALLKLQYSIQYTDYIMPICIPEETVHFPSGMYCFVTGWGSIRQGVSLSSPRTLQQVEIPIIEQADCDSMYHINNPTLNPNSTIIQWDMICAGYKDGQKDACQGDSGGPPCLQMGRLMASRRHCQLGIRLCPCQPPRCLHQSGSVLRLDQTIRPRVPVDSCCDHSTI